ncbi:MAG: putative toxin-antitoxin system toxin component, PIN family [Candidatus Blackburnbacteria bacterium]|nr:putative toxin-antitoxin system toxin component, PIN family [Candidatus Blackburnbacteria bacterium]
MIKALLDTNILVSGFASFKHPERPPSKILHAFRDGLFELVISEDILEEFQETLQDPYFKIRLSSEEISEVITLLSEETTVTPITIGVHGVATHPEDDLILAAAVSAKVNYLVTGDGPLLRKVGSSYQGVKLVTPNDFLKALEQQG